MRQTLLSQRCDCNNGQEEACGGNHHPGSIPSPCGNYPVSFGHQSRTGFDPAQVQLSGVKWTAA
ncbi:hypothetical protein DY000_02056222 [Brassica cretica]|uniref:Uncharacterized protein n=1 Tax=Brassica cretica TaxID=69181 RepID=A0ABQ7A9P5_BRACR|nr:hypothetical protein DY000_02056222 [Brassica cretica]